MPHDDGHSLCIAAGLASHWPSTAQFSQSGDLFSHTVEQTPQVAGHSENMNAGLCRHWSSSDQAMQADWFLSAQPDLQLGRSHDFGQALSVWPGLDWHSPSLAQPGQSFSLSLHPATQISHETAQLMFMKPALSVHCPSLAHAAQSVWRSAHLGAQKPHEVGHSLCMYAGDFVHSPWAAHAGQESSMSPHIRLHTPHEWGQMVFTWSALSPVHSPSWAQAAQDMSLSLQ
mmetsp:Transcript_3782/g.6226  ORF Transcript_3782/g.6226 Transcript_3782/m.6226 type:complete len:229 (+) Transcript_3782:420-1106(+)